MPAAGEASQGPKRKNLNSLEREEVIRYVLAGSNNGVLKRGAYKAAAVESGCEWQSIKRLWKKYEKQRQAGVAHQQLESGRKGKTGRKSIPIEELRARLREIPLNDRTIQRRLAAALGIPTTTLHRNLETLELKANSNALKASLTVEGKLERLRWVLRWVERGAHRTRVLHDFENFVNVDDNAPSPPSRADVFFFFSNSYPIIHQTCPTSRSATMP